jgi:hypothetical protein
LRRGALPQAGEIFPHGGALAGHEQRLHLFQLSLGQRHRLARAPQLIGFLAHHFFVLSYPDALALVAKFIGYRWNFQVTRHTVDHTQLLNGAVGHNDHIGPVGFEICQGFLCGFLIAFPAQFVNR